MRKAEIERKTSETNILVRLNLEGTGKTSFSTGLPFLEHMLDQIGRHGMIDLEVKAEGDLHIDAHHTVEDIGIAIGQALHKAINEKQGINRYGHSYIPLDEALSRVVLDFSGRPELLWKVNLGLKKIGEMDTELFEEFFKAFTNEAKCNLHIENFYGKNNHHVIESCFKAFDRSIKQAVEIDNKIKEKIPSSKGIL